MEQFVKVAIIGGGLSGLMAARTLQKHGVTDLVIIEKSRSVGGRLATRRIENGRVDHGAQFFTVRTQAFQTIVDQWLEAGFVRHWFGDNHPRYISEGGMNALAKQLAKDTPTLLNTRVASIDKESLYILTTEDGKVIHAEAVIVTAPTPQAIDLVKNIADTKQIETLETVQFDPCFVGIFEFGEASTFSEDGHQDKNLPTGILRVVDHEKKGISPIPTVSVYMDGDWSAQHYELADADVLAAVQEQVASLLPVESLRSAQLKRWRYAQAKTFIQQDEPFLQITEGLLIAGDTFLRADDAAGKTRMESAVLSGIAAGERVAKSVRTLRSK